MSPERWISLLSVLGALTLGIAALWNAHTGKRVGVSGVTSTARRDTIADRDGIIAAQARELERSQQQMRDLVTQHAADRAEWHDERAELRHRVEHLEEREREGDSYLMVHAAWDFDRYQEARRDQREVPQPPPLRPPRVPRPRDGEN